ncbi:MAG: pyridoxal phosphate-dependent aminotransferase, partial [Eubacteriales bacterium]|nr:pyridoxal phosphate-dependent aminotransferase [Eubacteriales bacterium]
PEEDENEFCEKAKKYELLLVPSGDFGVGGYVRIAYCVSESVIKNSLPAFEKLAKEYGLGKR